MAAGASSSLIVATEEALDTPMDYESVPKLGAQLGSASVIVIDDTVSIDWVVDKTVHFFAHESCGKCTPCREGTYWMAPPDRPHPRGRCFLARGAFAKGCRNPNQGQVPVRFG